MVSKQFYHYQTLTVTVLNSYRNIPLHIGCMQNCIHLSSCTMIEKQKEYVSSNAGVQTQLLCTICICMLATARFEYFR